MRSSATVYLLTTYELAEALGATRFSLRRIMKRLGIRPITKDGYRRKLSRDEIKQVMAAFYKYHGVHGARNSVKSSKPFGRVKTS